MNPMYDRVYDILNRAGDQNLDITDVTDEIVELFGDTTIPHALSADLSLIVAPLVELSAKSKTKHRGIVVDVRGQLKKMGFDWRESTGAALRINRLLAEARIAAIQEELRVLYEKKSVLSKMSDEFEDVKPSKKLLRSIKDLEAERAELSKWCPGTAPKDSHEGHA